MKYLLYKIKSDSYKLIAKDDLDACKSLINVNDDNISNYMVYNDAIIVKNMPFLLYKSDDNINIYFVSEIDKLLRLTDILIDIFLENNLVLTSLDNKLCLMYENITIYKFEEETIEEFVKKAIESVVFPWNVNKSITINI